MIRWWRQWRERARGLRCCDCAVLLGGTAGVPSESVIHGWDMDGDPRRRCRPCHERDWRARIARRQEAFARLLSAAKPASQDRPDDAEQVERAERTRAWHVSLIQARGVCVLRWWPRLDPCRQRSRRVAVADVTTRGAWPGSGADTVARVREVLGWERLRAPVTGREDEGRGYDAAMRC